MRTWEWIAIVPRSTCRAVHEHATAAVAGVPLGEDVAVERPEVAGVRGDGGRALTPDPRLTRRKRCVRDLDAGGLQAGAVALEDAKKRDLASWSGGEG